MFRRVFFTSVAVVSFALTAPLTAQAQSFFISGGAAFPMSAFTIYLPCWKPDAYTLSRTAIASSGSGPDAAPANASSRCARLASPTMAPETSVSAMANRMAVCARVP